MAKLRAGDLPVLAGTTSKASGIRVLGVRSCVPKPPSTRPPRSLHPPSVNLTDDDEAIDAWVVPLCGAAAGLSLLGFL